MKLPKLPFGKKEVKDEGTKAAAAVRTSGDRIIEELRGVRVKDSTNTIAQEKLEEYKEVIEACIRRLLAAKISCVDTSIIDVKFQRFTAEFSDAVYNGNEETADVCLSALTYGIFHAREEVAGKTPEEMKEIMKVREEKISAYENIYDCRTQVDASRESLDNLLANLEKDNQVYEKRYQEAASYCEEHGEEYEELKMVFASRKPVPVNLLTIDALQTKAISLRNNIKVRNLMRVFQELRIEFLETVIKDTMITLSKQEDLSLTKIKENTQKLNESFKNYMVVQMQDMEDLKELSKTFNNIVDSVLDSAAMKKEVTETNKQFERLKREHEQMLRQKEANEQRLKQKEQELENENEQEYNYN